MTTRLQAAPTVPTSARSGRWLTTPSGSLLASWSSASLSFLFTGEKLVLAVGGTTERKDKSNGGTPMIAILTGASEDAALGNTESWRSFDPDPNSEVVIFNKGTRQEKTYVRIVLIDWASTFELEAFLVDEAASIEPLPSTGDKQIPHILVIGDSISSGMAVSVDQGGEPIPFGVLNTFPFVAQRILREDKGSGLECSVELVGYPGYNLVRPTEEEKEKAGYCNGMAEGFFWDSPWSKDRLTDAPTPFPTAVIIELGTNDQFFKVSSERFGSGLIELVSSLKKWYDGSFRHVWLVPPFPDADTDNRELNEAMPTFIPLLEAQFGGGISFKVVDLVEGLTTANTVDGVHPPLAVHVDLGKKLAGFIASNLPSI
ncbi:hypothetical protein GALMADRAFT_246637 [Galerina marginata CBS 339.88]|uniref:Uncharacterized protein n=1 Tax=Galerina marginata (strain CBS 339.88) TaxID=685588 RepID=A0A067TE76_GALM3|nr:hypothetical protein GALMADRAFT_246637 [Galerina marginata CBS 339.88]